jgi:transposase InsO family protein
LPHSLIQQWPFCWWVAVAIDHTSRLVVGFALFPERPTSLDVCRFLDRAISRADAKPKYIIADKGDQFWCSHFKRWCRGRHIKPRFGAVGKHGSRAVIERFIRSLKDEGAGGVKAQPRKASGERGKSPRGRRRG